MTDSGQRKKGGMAALGLNAWSHKCCKGSQWCRSVACSPLLALYPCPHLVRDGGILPVLQPRRAGALVHTQPAVAAAQAGRREGRVWWEV